MAMVDLARFDARRCSLWDDIADDDGECRRLAIEDVAVNWRAKASKSAISVVASIKTGAD
jgi:hypothetical protein